MMDETASQAADIINEEESFNCELVDGLLREKKVERSDSYNRLLDNSIRLEIDNSTQTCKTTSVRISSYLLSQETTSNFDDRRASYFTTHHPSVYDSVIKSKLRQDIAFHRESKKLEKIWTNRGLPVDQEILSSAASKDAFNLRSLKESLPSTSASEKKPTFVNANRIVFRRQSLSAGHYKLLRSSRNWMQVSVLEPERKSVNAIWLQSGKQIEPSEGRKNSEAEKIPQSSMLPCQGQETRINLDFFLPKLAEMSPEIDEQEKREDGQNSDAENNQRSAVSAHLQKLCRVVGGCSSWDSRRNWVTDFQSQENFSPYNSSEKREANADKSDIIESLKKCVDELRQAQARAARRLSKLRALKSYRQMDVLPGGKDELENEDIASEQTPTVGHDNSVRDSVHSHLKKLMQRKRLMLLRESVKNFRSIGSHSSLGSLKSDKVVPD